LKTGATSRRVDRSPSEEGGERGAGGLTLELLIACSDEVVAKALNDALMPDNRYFPKDQRFRASREGTIASIISDAKLFRDIWVESRTRGLRNAAPG
jgi:hypothetical protein